MYSKRVIERFAGVSLLAGFAAFLLHGLTLYVHGATELTIFCVLIYGFLAILASLTLYLTLSRHERTLALFGAFGLAAHGLFVVLVCALILAQFKFAREFAVDGSESEWAVAVLRALSMTMDKVRTSAFVLMGFGLVPLGMLIIRSGVVARWVGWLGMIAGTAGLTVMLAGLFDLIAGGTSSILVVVTLLSLFAFPLVLGFRLVLWETRDA